MSRFLRAALFPTIVVVVLAYVLVTLLTGCGSDESSYEQTNPPGWLNHDTRKVQIILDGTAMTCIERRGEGGSVVSGQYGGLTCDWYGWHLRREAVAR